MFHWCRESEIGVDCDSDGALSDWKVTLTTGDTTKMQIHDLCV